MELTMEAKRSGTLQDKVRHLQRAYLAKLPQSLAQARVSMATLSEDETSEQVLDDLYRCFHNIKGTAASLGLLAISDESAIATKIVAQLQKLLEYSARRNEMVAKVAGLEALVSELEDLVVKAPESISIESSHTAMFGLEQGSRPGKMRGRIYLCDVAPDAMQLASHLACFGYLVSVFTELGELQRAVLESPPNAVVMTTKGIELAESLRTQVNVPFLFIADEGDFATRLRAVQAGGAAYFLKPITAHDMIDTLDELTIRREPDPFRVLIVDDEPEMADYLSLILEATGMLTRQLDQPARILDVLSEFQPDLVLMDMYMPICSGREFSRLIRQVPQYVGIPIVFLSSETNKVVQLSAMRVGADGFLTKPILPDDLITAVSVRAERTRTLRSLMMRDSLTGLLNHTTLAQFLETTLAASRRQGGRVCFVMLDIDHFKRVNDSFGHPAGDQVLVALARMLKQRLRSSDMVGRYGGEEFAIIMQDVSEDEAAETIRQIQRDFAALSFQVGDAAFSCTFSGGVSAFPVIDSTEQLVLAADQALYGAKHAGRNQVVTASQIKD
ncbi:MAG: diguanylate cyclase [Formivibrio sp.]|nr:diguanylate cyclase [Formivibrio sp.]